MHQVETSATVLKSSDLGIKIWIPGRIFPHHGIEDDQEFVHTGGDGHFEFFSFVAEALVELVKFGIMFNGREPRHVQGSTYFPAPPADTARAAKLAAIAV